MEVLGLSDEEMEDEALSPFNRLRGPLPLQEELTGSRFTKLPTALQPTKLQKAIPHHPWIDLLPLPTMRDNIFRRGFGSFDEEELCHAMRGEAPKHNPGLLVWRDTWDSTGWEVTEEFIGSWGWVIRGCADLLRSTNIWRARRGGKPLFLPVLWVAYLGFRGLALRKIDINPKTSTTYPNQFTSSQLPQLRRGKAVKCCKKTASSAQDIKPSVYIAIEIIPKWDEGVSCFGMKRRFKVYRSVNCEDR